MLARADVEVTFLEKRADFLRDFRGRHRASRGPCACSMSSGLFERVRCAAAKALSTGGGSTSTATLVAVVDFGRLTRNRIPYSRDGAALGSPRLIAAAGKAEPTFWCGCNTTSPACCVKGTR